MVIDLDFETKSPVDITKCGMYVYAEHPETDVLFMCWELEDGTKGYWEPGWQLPELFKRSDIQVRATNSMFEWLIWAFIMVPRYGAARLQPGAFPDVAIFARAAGVPGSLKKMGAAFELSEVKDAAGTKLIKKFSIPPYKTKGELPLDWLSFIKYCHQDVTAQKAVMPYVSHLTPFEQRLWDTDRRISLRGIQIDIEAAKAMQRVVQSVEEKEGKAFADKFGFYPSQDTKVLQWLQEAGVEIDNVQKKTLQAVKSEDPLVQEIINKRIILAASAIRKLPAFINYTCRDGRARGILQLLGAERTGRWAGRGPQPQNLPNSGPYKGWDAEAMDRTITSLKEGCLTSDYHPYKYIAGCLRGLFISKSGHDLICSDYSAIEARVLAGLAGEQWRMEVFATHGMIYEMSASKISGVPFQDFLKHKEDTGEHHPLRKTIGKVAELASGYQGSVGAWKAFGADKFMTDAEIKEKVDRWREESPRIKTMWYKLEDAAINAVKTPGVTFGYRGINYYCDAVKDVLYCTLPSERKLCYQKPKMIMRMMPWGKEKQQLSFMGVDSFSHKWCRIPTYGGKLTENVVQAVSRDILAVAIMKLEAAGYPVVLHVHDEVICEVPEGYGSVEELERIMADIPEWAEGWSIKADGGWRGKRYRK